MATTKKPKKPAETSTPAEDARFIRKMAFIRQLAEFLTKDAAMWSIKLEMNDPTALAWAKLRMHSTLFGYPTVEEAERALITLLK